MHYSLATLELQNKAGRMRKGTLTQSVVSELQGYYDPYEYRPIKVLILLL
jgi:hypothetical protein